MYEHRPVSCGPELFLNGLQQSGKWFCGQTNQHLFLFGNPGAHIFQTKEDLPGGMGRQCILWNEQPALLEKRHVEDISRFQSSMLPPKLRISGQSLHLSAGQRGVTS